MIECVELSRIVSTIPMVRGCDRIRSGALRMATPFTYPNGELVDLFLEEAKDLLGSYVVSDMGQTWMYLHDAEVKVDSTSRRKQMLADICAELSVQYRNGALEVYVMRDEIDKIPHAMLRLAQACIRLADFASHHRLRSANPFKDDVEDFIDALPFSYTADVKIPSTHGVDIRVDFEVKAPKVNSLVLVIGAMNETAGISATTSVFRKWHEIKKSGTPYREFRFITVYNSAANALRPNDVDLLRDESLLISYPQDGETLASVLGGGDAPPEVARQEVMF